MFFLAKMEQVFYNVKSIFNRHAHVLLTRGLNPGRNLLCLHLVSNLLCSLIMSFMSRLVGVKYQKADSSRSTDEESGEAVCAKNTNLVESKRKEKEKWEMKVVWCECTYYSGIA